MTCLLDTHALLWWLHDDRRLSRRARAVLADRGNEILVSPASAWEVATKHCLGKLTSHSAFVSDMARWVGDAGFRELPISIAHAARAGSFPAAHRDPFDRMLAAQSVIEEIPIVSRDVALEDLGAERLW